MPTPFLTHFLKSPHRRTIALAAKLDRRTELVRSREEAFSKYSDQRLLDSVEEIRESIHSKAESTRPEDDSHLIETAALGAAAIRRVMGFQLHDEQVRGALATADGAIIQMNAGEGKTMVCGLAALIRSVFDRSVHVATTNEYLAERDHHELAPVFRMLATTSSFIGSASSPDQLRRAYRMDIVYAAGYQIGFDYLRDQVILRYDEQLTLGRDVLKSINGRCISDRLTQTGHKSIIVDEADSVLIDESTTPLLLSEPGASPGQDDASLLESYERARATADSLEEGLHYQTDEIENSVRLTDEGRKKIHEGIHQWGRMSLQLPWPKYVENALYANHCLTRNEHYVVDDDRIKLVDQNTGRIFEDRSLRAGLHQALEAKEGVTINPPNRTVAQITRQRFFKLYDRVCGMTGTAIGSEGELHFFYGSSVVTINPHRTNQRKELPERYFATWADKLRAIVEDVGARRKTAQPILIGTQTIRESLEVQEALLQQDIHAIVLNGMQDEEEAAVVARAGQTRSLCIATNMAGRGTDIKLSKEALAAGGLHVVCAQRNASRRVDRQLAGRAGRQGDPGSCQFFIGADDELFRGHGASLARRIIRTADQNGESTQNFSNDIRRLQAEREAKGFERRKRMVQQDRWMNHIRETMVATQS